MGSGSVNVWLALWAVMGPIAIGAASAWWNRRNQVQDRDFTKSRDDESRAQARKTDGESRLRQDLANQLQWRRQTFIDFFSATFDFTYRGRGTQEADVRERHRERLSKCFAILIILDGANIGDEAAALWDACVAVSFMPIDHSDMAGAIRSLQAARTAFALKANHLIAEQIALIDPTTGLKWDKGSSSGQISVEE